VSDKEEIPHPLPEEAHLWQYNY